MWGKQLEPEVAFGIVLRELRKQRGLSQESLAHEAGMERNYISLLELGRNSASLKMIFRLAPVLGTSVAELMTLVDEKQKVGQKPKRGK
jgi:transcriptional regulator with XRE-family HTH domain